MERLCSNFGDDDEIPGLQKVTSFFNDLALAELESDGPFDVTTGILQQHGFRPRESCSDLSGFEDVASHQDANLLELPFEAYQDLQDMAREAHGIGVGYTEEDIDQEIRECGGLQGTEAKEVNEVTAPARAATTNAAGGFDFSTPTTESLSQ